MIQLRYLIAVIDAGSLSRAAAALHISQPALSQRMNQLEHELGVVLLDRGPRGVVATQAGDHLYRDARRLVRQFDQVAAAAAGHHPIRGLVSVGLPSAVATHLAAPLYSWTREQSPGIRLELFESMSGYIEELFARGRMDIALRYRQDRHEVPGGTYLYTEDLYLVGDPGPGIGTHSTVALSELSGVPLVAPGLSSSLRSLIEHAFSTHGIEQSVVADVESLATMLQIAETGDACALLPLSAAAASSVPVRRVVSPTLQRHAYACIAAELSAPREAVAEVHRGIVAVTHTLCHTGRWPGVRTDDSQEPDSD